MPEPLIVITVLLTFLLAGTVKGVIGLGLPTVSLALLTVAIDLPSAMALLLVPSFVTNIWQALIGGNTAVIVRRIWPFLAMATMTVWIGALALTRIHSTWLSGLLGLLLIAYATISLVGYRISLTPHQESWLGPVIGSANGILTGMTGSFVVPGVMFLQAIGLPRDLLIQAMGMLFSVSTVALALALKGNNLLTAQLGGLSLVAVLPAIIGMWSGQHLPGRLSALRFRKVFFSALLLLGIYIVTNALIGVK